ncbi:MAG: carboxypeptidase regulatory-like domain-containing protein [Niabella sp.]|nr:carboxypeptidase regulatory-like domain-containing protein [Niabella sp.]
MKKVLLLLPLLSLMLCAAAQQNELHISGTVTDSLGKAVPDAIVSLIRLSDNAGLLFTATDQHGNFLVDSKELFRPQTLAIKVTAAGFLKQQTIINAAAGQLKFSMRSVADAHILPVVVVIGKQHPIVQKGDTLSYDAARFTDKNDRHLRDIIQKLPGVEVEENGTIKYQGKAINKFYIEGDNLLDDRYTIATDNINVADVDKVQVIEHNQHVKMLNGIIPSDRAALNIVLKNKSKLKFLNSLEATGGLPATYNLEGKSMAFKTKFKAINLAKGNDAGFDYSRETGSSGLPVPEGISRERALENRSQLFSANNLIKLTPYTAIKINATYNKENQQTNHQLAATYYLPGGDSIFYKELNQDQYNAGSLNLNIALGINSPKNYLSSATNFSRNNNTNSGSTYTSNSPITQNSSATTTRFSNTLSGYLMIRKMHIINYENSFAYSVNPQLLILIPGILQNVLNDSIPYLQTNQYQQLKNLSNTSQVAYNRVFQNWVLGLTTGLFLQSQQLHSAATLTQQSTQTTAPEGFGNAVNWGKNELFAQATLTYNGYKSKLILGAPVSWQHYRYYNDFIAANQDKGTRLVFQPSFHWEYKTGKENTVYLDYTLVNKTAGVQQIYGGAIISGYRSFASYETPYLMSRAHTFSGGFDYKRVIKAFFANLNMTFAPTKNYFLYSTTLQNNMTLVKALPVINYSQAAGTTVRVSKYIFSLNTTITADAALSATRLQLLQNEQLFRVLSIVRTAGLQVTPTVLKWLQFTINGKYMQYTTASGQTGFLQQEVRQWNLRSGLTLYPLNRFSFNFTNNYYQSLHRGSSAVRSLFLDSYLQYKFEKKSLLVRLACTNIANVRSYEMIDVSSNSITTISYHLRPRTVSLMASFDF